MAVDIAGYIPPSLNINIGRQSHVLLSAQIIFLLLCAAPPSCRKGTCDAAPGNHRERHAAWNDADGIPNKVIKGESAELAA